MGPNSSPTCATADDDRGAVRHVDLDADARRRKRVGGRGGGGLVDVAHRDRRTERSEPRRDCRTDALTRTGDHGNAAIEGHDNSSPRRGSGRKLGGRFST